MYFKILSFYPLINIIGSSWNYWKVTLFFMKSQSFFLALLRMRLSKISETLFYIHWKFQKFWKNKLEEKVVKLPETYENHLQFVDRYVTKLLESHYRSRLLNFFRYFYVKLFKLKIYSTCHENVTRDNLKSCHYWSDTCQKDKKFSWNHISSYCKAIEMFWKIFTVFSIFSSTIK